jgi:hypothetical protein
MKKFNLLYVFMFLFVISALTHQSCTQGNSIKLLSGETFQWDSSTTVFIVLSTECPICQKYQGNFKGISYQGTKLYYVFPGNQNLSEVIAYANYDSLKNSSVVLDLDYELCKTLGADVTPQALIFKDKKLKYKGAIDDRFQELGASKRSSSINYVENALISLKNNDSKFQAETKSVGCFIEYP